MSQRSPNRSLNASPDSITENVQDPQEVGNAAEQAAVPVATNPTEDNSTVPILEAFPPGFNPLLLPESLRQLPLIAAKSFGDVSKLSARSAASVIISPPDFTSCGPPPGIPVPSEIKIITDPPKHLTKLLVPQGNTRPTARLVMEQLRADQSIRVPYGWDEFSESWIRVQHFRNGLPSWPSHVFWGRFDQGAGEVVQVAMGRQLFYYKQYKFWESYEALYMREMTSPPEESTNIDTHFAGPSTCPSATPYELSGMGYGCRLPQKDEYIPTDAFPYFAPHLRPPNELHSLAHFDNACEIFYKKGIISFLPPKFAPGEDHVVPDYRLTAAYTKVEKLTESSEHVAGNGLDADGTPVTESKSALYTALEQDYMSMGMKTDATQESTPSRASPASNLSLSLVTIKSSGSSAEWGHSLQEDLPKSSASMTQILEEVKASKSEVSLPDNKETTAEKEPEANDVVRTPSDSESTSQDETTRVATEERLMETLLATDLPLKDILSRSDQMWQEYCAKQKAVREGTTKIVPESWPEVVKQMVFEVLERDRASIPSASTANQFVDDQVVLHRTNGNYRMFHLWTSLRRVSPLPKELVDDVAYLKAQFDGKNNYSQQEAQWFDSFSTLDSFDQVVSLPAEPEPLTGSGTLSYFDKLYSVYTLKKNLAVYCKRQELIRNSSLSLEILRCNAHEVKYTTEYKKYETTLNAMAPQGRFNLKNRVFTHCLRDFCQMKKSHDTYVKHAYSIVFTELLNSFSKIIGSDAYVIEMKLKSLNKKKSTEMFSQYIEAVFGKIEAPDAEVINEFLNIPLPTLSAATRLKIDESAQKHLNNYVSRQERIRSAHRVPLQPVGLNSMENELTSKFTTMYESHMDETPAQREEGQKYLNYLLYVSIAIKKNIFNESVHVQYQIAKSFKLLKDTTSDVLAFDAYALGHKLGDIPNSEWFKLAEEYYSTVFSEHSATVLREVPLNADEPSETSSPDYPENNYQFD